MNELNTHTTSHTILTNIISLACCEICMYVLVLGRSSVIIDNQSFTSLILIN